ncbi:uncharacterized protein [Periplaneta americana]|uniref:uncharacterized protein n=1 Tax=Periplaneta americana TaxID=6978 RepID=UPI0037E82936
MCTVKRTLLVFLGLATFAAAAISNDTPAQDIANSYNTSEERTGKMTGLKPANVLADIAREMVMRSTTNSQVLSLNLTNLFILLVLKALLFGAGLFSFGFLKHGGGTSGSYGRSSDDDNLIPDPRANPLITESELLLLLTYLMGDANNDYNCLHRVACEEPKKAREYVTAAKMLIKGARIFNTVVPYNPKYEGIVAKLQEAVDYGISGEQCEVRYKCSSKS